MEDCGLIIALIILVIFVFALCKRRKVPRVEKRASCEPMVAAKPKPMLSEGGSFQDFMINEGLDKSVVESHNRFTEELQQRTTGSSSHAERTDDNDINPWRGLRRTNYQGVSAAPEARVTHSEDQSQMYRPNTRKYV